MTIDPLTNEYQCARRVVCRFCLLIPVHAARPKLITCPAISCCKCVVQGCDEYICARHRRRCRRCHSWICQSHDDDYDNPSTKAYDMDMLSKAEKTYRNVNACSCMTNNVLYVEPDEPKSQKKCLIM
jgi:hypothetical protein